MPENLKIKICGMREPENLREIATLSPDYFGLIFYPKSPRYISIEQAERLPRFQGTEYVGVFVNEDAGTMLDYATRAGLFVLQLHGDESPQDCRLIKKLAGRIKLIKAFAVGADFDGNVLKDYEAACDYFLFDTKTENRGGSGHAFDWQILQSFPIKRPFFLSGGVGPENATKAIAACEGLPLYALDLNSRVEISPGLKSVELVKQIIRNL